MSDDTPHDDTTQPDATEEQQIDQDVTVEFDDEPEDGQQSDDDQESAWEKAAGTASQTKNKSMGILGRIALVLKMWVVAPLTFLLKFVPRSDGIADTLIMAGLRYKKKLAKADGITFMVYGDGQVVPRANRWHSADRKYVTDNGEEVSAAGEGHDPYYMGKTPVTFSLRAAAETFEPVLAFFAMKAEQGEWMKAVRPDGGTDVLTTSDVPGSADAQLLSWEKAWELYAQKITREDLDEQYRMGYLDGLEEDGQLGPMKTILIYGAGILTTLVIIFALDFIGGGGGGSMVPLMLGGF